jgi:hypothetical protein
VRLMLAAVTPAREPKATADLAALLNGTPATVARSALHEGKGSNMAHGPVPRIDAERLGAPPRAAPIQHPIAQVGEGAVFLAERFPPGASNERRTSMEDQTATKPGEGWPWDERHAAA